jgi:hypothetical protein
VVAESKRKPIPKSPNLLVTISGKLPVTSIAKMLDSFLPNQIAIPVGLLNDEPVELIVKRKKVAEIAESLGLVITDKTGKGQSVD